MAAARLAHCLLYPSPSILAPCPFSASCSSSSPPSSFPVISLSPSAFGFPSRAAARFPDRHCKQLGIRAVAEAVTEAEATPELTDSLTMLFRAEGTLADSAVSRVVQALENVEGVKNVKVSTAEGIATAELTKQTFIQATGEASFLVELIQGEGFKLQTLCLSFDDADAEDDDDIMFEYDNSS